MFDFALVGTWHRSFFYISPLALYPILLRFPASILSLPGLVMHCSFYYSYNSPSPFSSFGIFLDDLCARQRAEHDVHGEMKAGLRWVWKKLWAPFLWTSLNRSLHLYLVWRVIGIHPVEGGSWLLVSTAFKMLPMVCALLQIGPVVFMMT